MSWSSFFMIIAALTYTQIVSTQTKFTRTKANFFAPVLSQNAYTGRIKENEQIVKIEPPLYASDPDPSNTDNGKICGYELSLHKHDDLLDEITANIPFVVEIINKQAVVKSTVDTLDCEVKQTYRLFLRAFDCAPNDQRRYSERSSLVITVDDVNEYAPVFTHQNYLFKLHDGQTCDANSCRVEATDDDCANADHHVCGYEIITPNVPFAIDFNGIISMTKPLTSQQYEFDVIAIDCYSANDTLKKVSQPARVTFKIIPSCKPSITDNASEKLLIQSDNIHLFDSVNLNTCDETCQVEDIVGKVELLTNGLHSGCNLEQCSTTNREYVLLTKDDNAGEIPSSKITSFNGLNQALTVNQSDFPGHFNNEFTIRMWMKHTSVNDNMDKEHIFCKSDEKLKNRHHAALLIQNGYLKLLLRNGPVSSNDKTSYASEWIWKVPQINDNQWHSYELVANYPQKIDLYIDEQLINTNNENFQVVKDYPLFAIQGTEDTVLTLGACWHARGSRMVQHFHGELSGLTIEQKEELQRSSGCIRECQQYLDIPNIQSESGLEFTSNANRSMWILRTDTSESYEKLLKHLVYRNTFQPIGPYGERKITIQTQIKCFGEPNTYDFPTFTRSISIEEPKLPLKIELKSDTNYLVPEDVINSGIYLFRNLSIYTNALKKSYGDISECSLTAEPPLSISEILIIPESTKQEIELTKNGAWISGTDSIDSYQYLLRQIAYISKSPLAYIDRQFTLSCAGAYDQASTNEFAVRIHVEQQMPEPVPVAAVLSDTFFVDNDQIRDNTFDVMEQQSRSTRNAINWPIAIVVCASVGFAGVLALYLIVRIRSNNRLHNPTANTGDDLHSQMEWEDDIGLNITVNPLDETKKTVQSLNTPHIGQPIDGYPGSSSDDDEDENNARHPDFSDDDNEDGQNRPRKIDHQLEWDDAAIEYGPKKL